MKIIWTLTVRELKTFFDSLMAYLLLVLFLAGTGFFTWLFGGDVFMTKQASLDQFFGWAFVFISVLIPAITMKMISEEKRTGTIELLLTKSISDWQVIIGKYLACLLLVLIALLLTPPIIQQVPQPKTSPLPQKPDPPIHLSHRNNHQGLRKS